MRETKKSIFEEIKKIKIKLYAICEENYISLPSEYNLIYDFIFEVERGDYSINKFKLEDIKEFKQWGVNGLNKVNTEIEKRKKQVNNVPYPQAW